MPGKFLNEITADKPAKDDLGLFFDKSKNTTAQSSLVDIVAAGLDLTSGKAGEAPVVIETVNPDGTKTQSLGWAKTASSGAAAPPRPANATDLIITHDPASGTDGAATPAQVLTAGLPAGGNAGDALTLTASGLAWGSSLPASTTGDKGKQLTVQADGKVAWSSDSSDLPAYTVADKGKQLAVKADGTAVEWVTDAPELPAHTVADAGKQLSIKADGTIEWHMLLPAHTEIEAGRQLAINPAGTSLEWQKTHTDSTESTNIVNALFTRTGDISVCMPRIMDKFYKISGLTTSTITHLNVYGVERIGLNGTNILRLSNNTSIKSLSFPDLSSAAQIQIQSFSGLDSISFPYLERVFGQFQISSTALKTMTLSSGIIYAGTVDFSQCSSLTTVNIPVFNVGAGGIKMQNCTALTSATIAAVTCAGTIDFSGCTALTTLAIQALCHFGIGAKSGAVPNLTATGCALTVGSIKQLLVDLVRMDGNNGTSKYCGTTLAIGNPPASTFSPTVNLSGGTSAGLAALDADTIKLKDALVARGVTVTLNP